MEKDAALRTLEAVADALARDGHAELAERARDAVSALRRDGHDEAGVMSPDEAAKALGVRNVGMIGRWAREGLLDGCWVGGHLRVSRRSVERMVESPVVANERAFERRFDEVMEAFDFGDDELPPSVIPHAGRAPWDRVDTDRS